MTAYIQRIPYFKTTLLLFLLFMIAQNIARASMLFQSIHDINIEFSTLPHLLAVSFIYDLIAFSFLFPIIVIFFFLTKLGSYSICRILFFFIYIYILLFTTIAEYLFWEEFGTRFNFIAVDYLVYTHEVIGNILESYPVTMILSVIGVICALFALLIEKIFKIITRQESQQLTHRSWYTRSSIVFFSFALPIICFLLSNNKLSDITQNRYINELSKNGYFELFSAFRNNDLPYEEFYLTEQDEYLFPILKNELITKNSEFTGDGIKRAVKSIDDARLYNVILITVESLSAEFLSGFGNTTNLTPNLDLLTHESLFFSNLHATGTRTVYGLSAITLSIPPSPGNSIIRRPGNENLISLGSILNSNGYESSFIYGGYGYFDNMNYFFGTNGYKVVDRADLSSSEITFANIWGVCDEDLFNKVIKESNNSYARSKPFFNMVMTTSNHRPFTYPDGKIDIPSGFGREGGVKYTDYAIGKFLLDAKKEPWFDNTIFVIVADHTASSAGKMELQKEKYHIPMWIFAPKIVMQGEITQLMSQIDIAPTILGMLNISYTAPFYGKNAMNDKIERAFISNYQKLGYLTNNSLLILKPVKDLSFYNLTESHHEPVTPDSSTLDLAISYFQLASKWQYLQR